jgi:hypothetical protein
VNAVLAAVLLLHPVLASDGHLRLVAVGTGHDDVAWTLDGREVARTADGQAASIAAPAGEHALWATSAARSEWRALARPDGGGPGGAEQVPAWTAVHSAEAQHAAPAWMLPVGTLGASLAVLVRPRMLLQALRRARRA